MKTNLKMVLVGIFVLSIAVSAQANPVTWDVGPLNVSASYDIPLGGNGGYFYYVDLPTVYTNTQLGSHQSSSNLGTPVASTTTETFGDNPGKIVFYAMGGGGTHAGGLFNQVVAQITQTDMNGHQYINLGHQLINSSVQRSFSADPGAEVSVSAEITGTIEWINDNWKWDNGSHGSFTGPIDASQPYSGYQISATITLVPESLSGDDVSADIPDPILLDVNHLSGSTSFLADTNPDIFYRLVASIAIDTRVQNVEPSSGPLGALPDVGNIGTQKAPLLMTTTVSLASDLDDDGDGYTENQGDCDDSDNRIHPGATEVCGDGIDQNCNGSDLACAVDPADTDDDGDGYTENQGDCDDSDNRIHPGATEVCGDGIDQNCNGSDLACAVDPADTDDDGDGYTENQGDCNDSNNRIHPGATEVCGDGIDQNCDGSDLACSVDPADTDDDYDGYTENQGDCNDLDNRIYPGATEICDDGIDQDCDGSDADCTVGSEDTDDDGDGYTETLGDCDDSNATIYPGAQEIIGDGIDQDCNGINKNWNTISGSVSYHGTSVCAMVLANGQYMFSCGANDGVYELDVPLDNNGEITVQVFVSGLAPYRMTTDDSDSNMDIDMQASNPQSKPPAVTTVTASDASTPAGWARISGTVRLDETPLCAMVLANGQYMFSCNANNGIFDLTVPLDSNGEITLFVFVSGLQPYRETFVP